jgi:hypothetical protein
MQPAPTGPRAGGGVRLARNRHRQRELYGAPLGDRVRRLTTSLGITQARLAHTLGLSPAMLSQLASARRVKIGDPAVLARLQLLDQRCGAGAPRGAAAVDALLDEVARARLRWTAGDGPPARPASGQDAEAGPADVLRGVAPPSRLAAAAATLAAEFPEVAEVLRQAATHPVRGPRRSPGRPW